MGSSEKIQAVTLKPYDYFIAHNRNCILNCIIYLYKLLLWTQKRQRIHGTNRLCVLRAKMYLNKTL